MAPARAAAARADLHDRRDAGAVPVHAVLLDAVVEPGPARVAAVRRAQQLHRRGQGQSVLVGGRQHRHPDRRRGADLGAARLADRAAAGSRVPRPRRGPDTVDHAVPDHPRRGCADLEDDDPRSQQRHPQLGALAGGHRPGGLDRSVPAGDGDGRIDLAVDAVHDAADPGRPDVDAARPTRGGPGRRCDRVPALPGADAAAPSALHRTGRRCSARSTWSTRSTRSS